MPRQKADSRLGARLNASPAGFVAITLAVTGGLQVAFVADSVVAGVAGAAAGVVWALGAVLLMNRLLGARRSGIIASSTALFASVVTTGLVFAARLFGAIERYDDQPGRVVAEDFASPAADRMGAFFNIANGSTEWLIMPAVVLLV
jgi:hypothetical protein